MLMVPITGATPLLLEVVLLIVSVSNTWPEASLRQLWRPDTWRTPTVSNEKKLGFVLMVPSFSCLF